MGKKPTLVMVPGAWHGPWALAPLSAKLAERGVASICVTTTSLDGKDKRGIPADVEETNKVIDGCPGDVVLVGHSFGGIVITEAGAHEKVRSLVYLAAFMPKMSETANGLMVRTLAMNPLADTLAKAMSTVPGDRALIQLETRLVAKHLYGDCAESTIQFARSNLRPHNRNVFKQRPKFTAWQSKPSTYIICRQDKAIPPRLQRKLARRATHTIEMDTSHSPFFSNIDCLAAILSRTTR